MAALPGLDSAPSSAGLLASSDALSASAPTAANLRHVRWTLLERIAAAGLCPKVHIEFIPELMAIIRGLDEIARASDCEPDVVARAWVLLRGVRGLRGVQWMTGFLRDHWPELRRNLDRRFARTIKSDLNAHGAAEHPDHPNWAAHAEGLHRGLSGRFFVEALNTAQGRKGVNEVVRELRPLVSAVLASTSQIPARLEADTVLQIMRLVQGRIVLRAQPKLSRAAGYNAMDFARSFMSWAVLCRCAVEAPMSQEVWLELQQRQGGKRRKISTASGDSTPNDFFHIASASDVEACLLRLRRCAVPLLPLEAPASIAWPTFFVCLCETRQTLQDSRIGLAGLEVVLREPRANYLHVAQDCLRDILAAGGVAQGCVMTQVVLAALQYIRSQPARTGGVSLSRDAVAVENTATQAAAIAPGESQARTVQFMPFSSADAAVRATLAEMSSLQRALAHARQRLQMQQKAERLQERNRLAASLGVNPEELP